MTHRKTLWIPAVAVGACLFFVGQAFAQDGPGPGGPDGPGGPGGGRLRRFLSDPNFLRGFDPNMIRAALDPNAARKMAADRLKDALKATDEEWTVLEPKVEKVMTLQLQLQGGGIGMMVMSFLGGGEPSELMKAQQALSAVLAKSDSSPGDIADALKAFRAARTKARAELAKAQADLKEVLTLRQESILVRMGMMD
jgi:hypothetical protein